MWEVIKDWTGVTLIASAITSLLGMGLATYFVIQMPADHFVSNSRPPKRRHPVVHWIWVILKNTLGGIALVLGIFMLVFPGPGLIAILLGLSLVDLPGKQWLLYQGLRLKSVRRSMNWIRKKSHKPPLKFPSSGDST